MDALDDSERDNDFSIDFEDPANADNAGASSGGVVASTPASRFFPSLTRENLSRKKVRPLQGCRRVGLIGTAAAHCARDGCVAALWCRVIVCRRRTRDAFERVGGSAPVATVVSFSLWPCSYASAGIALLVIGALW